MPNSVSRGGWVLLGSLALPLAGCLSRQAQQVREQERGAAAAEPSRVSQEGGEVGITLDSATAARIGLRVEPLTATSRTDEWQLPAFVIPDPAGASIIRTGVAGRLAAGPQGWPAFGQRVAAGTVVGVVGDALPIAAPAGGMVSRVLARPGELVQAGQELLELTDFGAPLVRVGWEPGLPPPPPALAFGAAEGAPQVRGLLVGPAVEADPLTRNPAWLYRIGGGWHGVRPGAAVTAFLPRPGSGHRAVLIPVRAVVQWDALAWAYVMRAPGRYVRVRVPTDRPTRDGWLVAAGFAPGEQVVTTGASQLLSEEFRARIVVGEEVGE